MPIALRPIEPADVPEAGRICHDAFKAIAGQHNFPPDFREPQVAIDLLSQLTANRGFYGVVAEQDGRVVGSNFVDERSPIVGLGPITVDPTAQNQGVGAALMRHMVDRAARNQAAGLRLVQSCYHLRSLCLYAKLGGARAPCQFAGTTDWDQYSWLHSTAGYSYRCHDVRPSLRLSARP